jgi:hypothetical protein
MDTVYPSYLAYATTPLLTITTTLDPTMASSNTYYFRAYYTTASNIYIEQPFIIDVIDPCLGNTITTSATSTILPYNVFDPSYQITIP